jgi:hypothetical protein
LAVDIKELQERYMEDHPSVFNKSLEENAKEGLDPNNN